MFTTLADAAHARSQKLTIGDRPSKRSSLDSMIDPTVRVKAQIHVREASAGEVVTFEGYASTTEQPYEMYDFFGPYQEIVSQGAFEQTLSSSPNVPLVLQHDSMRRIASTQNGTLTLEEDDQGLHVLAQLDPTDQDVQYILPKLRSGLISEMSFAFQITSSQWSPDYEELRINSVNIDRGDVSIVGFGANPNTSAEVRARSLTELLDGASVDELRTIQSRTRLRLRDLGAEQSMSLEELARVKLS